MHASLLRDTRGEGSLGSDSTGGHWAFIGTVLLVGAGIGTRGGDQLAMDYLEVGHRTGLEHGRNHCGRRLGNGSNISMHAEGLLLDAAAPKAVGSVHIFTPLDGSSRCPRTRSKYNTGTGRFGRS